MKATTKIEVTVEAEKQDAARLYNMAREERKDCPFAQEIAGERFRAALNDVIARAVSVGIEAYRAAKM